MAHGVVAKSDGVVSLQDAWPNVSTLLASATDQPRHWLASRYRWENWRIKKHLSFLSLQCWGGENVIDARIFAELTQLGPKTAAHLPAVSKDCTNFLFVLWLQLVWPLQRLLCYLPLCSVLKWPGMNASWK